MGQTTSLYAWGSCRSNRSKVNSPQASPNTDTPSSHCRSLVIMDLKTTRKWKSVESLFDAPVGPGLHGACPVVAALGDGHIAHQQVTGEVAGSEGTVGGLQEGQARNAAGTALLPAHHQPICMQAPAPVQVEIQH
ncbi:hypothetical protein JZ751_000164 [Albula glossodonta]|uniref:Uncharacterized protein n=1 Tax=Albula glossodonta TaxID=121402 RepID=A0A8T2PVS7_9TELE|nr:hypothetical protein JZ751_000164 [Albula glossodonta]